MQQFGSGTPPRHTVGVVCRLTGLKPDRLRAWERRYQVVRPTRSAGNQRLYSEDDVERLRLLGRATSNGYRIARVAHLPIAELRALVHDIRFEPAEAASDTDQHETVATSMKACLAAIQQMDPRRLRRELRLAAKQLPAPVLSEELLVPLVHQVGDLWADGGIQPAHEHLATAVLVQFIGERAAKHPSVDGAPKILIATLQGQRHGLGAMLAAETATADGWSTVYLGPDLPAVDIAAAARQTSADVVGLSFVYPANDPEIPLQLQQLRSHLGPDLEVIAGGTAAATYDESLQAIGATRVDDLADLRAFLRARDR